MIVVRCTSITYIYTYNVRCVSPFLSSLNSAFVDVLQLNTRSWNFSCRTLILSMKFWVFLKSSIYNV